MTSSGTNTPSPGRLHGGMILRKNVLTGLLFMAVAVLGLYLSRDYSVGTALRMGTGYVPRLLCWLLAGLGLLIAVQGILSSDTPLQREQGWRPLVFVPLSILIFALTIEKLGVVIATLLLIGTGTLAGKGLRTLEVALTTLLLVAITVGIFVWGLGLTMPVWPEW